MGLCSQRKGLEAWNFEFNKKRGCTIQAVKMKALISFAVTTKLVRAFVFAEARTWLSHDVVHNTQEPMNCQNF